MINAIRTILGMNKPVEHQLEVDNFINQLSTYKYYNN